MEEPSGLELFLLFLLRDGPKTVFQVHSETGISVGSCLPALKRLADRRWLTAAKPAARRQVAYAIAPEGKDVMKRWREMIDAQIANPGEDADAAIRLAAIAWLEGDRARAKNVLQSSASALASAAQGVKPDSTSRKTDLANFHQRTSSSLSRSRRLAEARALRDLSRHLPRLR
jgi:DNA-binding PadR family transcriptional regulator